MTNRCLGISLRFKASVEVITLSLSTGAKGKLTGLEPVAIIKYLDSNSSLLPSSFLTASRVADIKVPTP